MNIEPSLAFQVSIVVINVISGLAAFAIRREIAHLREIVTLRFDLMEKRVEKLEKAL